MQRPIDQTGAHPADAAGASDERRRVTALRAKSPPTPWAHVSRQVGKSEDYLRRVYAPLESVLVGVVTAVSPPVASAPSPPEFGTARCPRPAHDRLALALAKAECSLTRSALAELIGSTPGSTSAAIARLVADGLAINARPGTRWLGLYALTPAGRKRAAELRELLLAKSRGQA